MDPMLSTKFLKLGAAAKSALFIAEKNPPVGAKASAAPFIKPSSGGLVL
jgi:hypothetical protein